MPACPWHYTKESASRLWMRILVSMSIEFTSRVHNEAARNRKSEDCALHAITHQIRHPK